MIMEVKVYLPNTGTSYAIYATSGKSFQECKNNASKYPWWSTGYIGNKPYVIQWLYNCDVEAMNDINYYFHEVM